VKEAEVVSTGSLPAHEQSAEAVVPGVGALDHPAARPALHAAEERLLAAAPDVRGDPASANGGLGVLVGWRIDPQSRADSTERDQLH
jgi:hypothetical protein